MGPCISSSSTSVATSSSNIIPGDINFTADLFQQSNHYYQCIMHAGKTNLFKQRTSRLQNAVQEYLNTFPSYNTHNMDIVCVDSTHKLHPKDFSGPKITKQYLIQACLRQESFIRKLHVKCITYEKCRQKYCKFLNLVKQRPKQITVPDLAEDFMWHSHMQNNEKYKHDTKEFLGWILNHDDQIPEEKLKEYWDGAIEKRNEKYKGKDMKGQEFKQYQLRKDKVSVIVGSKEENNSSAKTEDVAVKN